MAAMAELSPEFYEKFGVKTANELTGWLNSMMPIYGRSSGT